MAQAENLVQVSKKSGESGLIHTKDRNIPYHALTHPTITPLFNHTAPKVLEDAPNTLKPDNIIEVVTTSLSQEQGLRLTIDSLFPDKNAQVEELNILPIQMGRKAYIILCQAKTSEGKGHFAMHIGRNANDSVVGNEAERDFSNLKDLSDAADRRLTDKAKRKYKFLKPFALFEPVRIDGHEYSSFSMPFVDDYGELRADVHEDLSSNMRFPYFRYSVDFSRKMKEVNAAALKRNRDIVSKFERLHLRFPGKSPEYIVDQYYKLPEVRAILKQSEELLIGNALIYLLSDGHFPKDFLVNSGDWMVKFANDSLLLYLITIRGGWEHLGSDDRWMKKMIDHTEPVPGREMEGVAIPLFYSQEETIKAAIDNARKLLK